MHVKVGKYISLSSHGNQAGLKLLLSSHAKIKGFCIGNVTSYFLHALIIGENEREIC
jgi:hypothetical protein